MEMDPADINMEQSSGITALLAGPILRRCTQHRLTLWLATSAPADIKLQLFPADGDPQEYQLQAGAPGYLSLRASPRLHYQLIDLPLSQPLPNDCWIAYQLNLRFTDRAEKGWQRVTDLAADICYPGCDMPGFYLPAQVGAILHGSCRKPHHAGGDGLVAADKLLKRCLPFATQTAPAKRDAQSAGTGKAPVWPSMLVMSGDQIYADDVAGPILSATHQLLAQLQLPRESLADLQVEGVDDSDDLYAHPDSYYRRESLLPDTENHNLLSKVLFAGARKPIFTSDNAHNHLISLGEFLANYLLVWSPAPWQLLENSLPDGLSGDERALFEEETRVIDEFVSGLSAARRLMAHLPTAMVFDDHDISDDWNLNRDWEEMVYGHPLSRRMIGNGLIAYLLHQGWGNAPERFEPSLFDKLQCALDAPGSAVHDELIQQLLGFEGWDFDWPTAPPLVVLDTRTRRWRSETSAHKPSGLLDWEALTDLQRRLRGHSAVLLVSAAPIFGVKLIEVIQRIFTRFGKPLLVDAENWMAHPGTSHGILNVFRHSKTPQNFVVLSGDVHYSFVYDVELRGRRHGPDIWQICSSGLRNTFPTKLLAILDHLNRWLYSPRSPLNWFTSRRQMRITPRKPEGTPTGRRLLNSAGIGLAELDGEGRPWRIRQLLADGREVLFERREEESNWH